MNGIASQEKGEVVLGVQRQPFFSVRLVANSSGRCAAQEFGHQMTKEEKFSDSSWWQPRYEVIEEIASRWKKHSRQAEATFGDVLWHVPDDVLQFIKDRVYVIWKRNSQVGLLLPPEELGNRYLVILDTKIETQSRGVRQAILSLKIAEAYLREHPEIKLKREDLVRSWDIDLAVLDGEHAWGFKY